MKYVDDYRNKQDIDFWLDRIKETVSRPHTLMEICGGQTHTIVKYGIDQLLPDAIELIHGPGCPVCVTSTAKIDLAIELANQPDIIFCSFGDMVRVPGSSSDLLSVKASGGDIRIVYSPLDAVQLAEANPEREIVFFAVGFETTAPANALAVYLAKQRGIQNFSLLVSHVLVPPAIEALLRSPDNRVGGFLAAGHVCTVMGYREYVPLAEKYRVPIVVTGFEPLDIVQGVYLCVCQLEQGRAEVENQYNRVVEVQGNQRAQQLVCEVFEVIDQDWRGLGAIKDSGLALSPVYREFDAEIKFRLDSALSLKDRGEPPCEGTQPVSEKPRRVEENTECISGQVMAGIKKPHQCPSFGTTCTPECPLGAPMVSTEGACAAYYLYRQ